MRGDIDNALKTKFGVSSASQLADHVMYCLPDGTMSGKSALVLLCQMNSCVQYGVLTSLLLHLTSLCFNCLCKPPVLTEVNTISL